MEEAAAGASSPRDGERVSRMFSEAAEAPQVVARQLAANAPVVAGLAERLRRMQPRAVVTCARGSSDHAATYARYLIETRLGVLTASAAPSVSSVYRADLRLKGAVFLAISQSGAGPDVAAAAEAAGAQGALVVALVNVEDSRLAAAADVVLPLQAGPELSIAATKSYLGSLSALAQLLAAWARDEALTSALGELPDQLAQAWDLDWSPLVDRLTEARSLYVVGRGIGLGAAQEAALKLKETCRLHAEAFSGAEMRHGPMALLEPGFPMLVFAQEDEARAGLDELVGFAASQGADVTAAGAAPHPEVVALPVLESHPALQPVLLVQSFYRAAESLARARGLDPDSPPHLQKVTRTT